MKSKKPENGTDDFFKQRMLSAQIPNIDTSKITIPKSDSVRGFISMRSNLVIMGSTFLPVCAKLSEYVIYKYLWHNILWLSQDSINFSTIEQVKNSDIKFCFIMNPYHNSDLNKNCTAILLNHLIGRDIKIVIGANSVSNFESVFENNLDLIEYTFEVVKV